MDPAEERFTRLYEAHVDRVMTYCLRHLPPQAAEDAVSDTFVVAWRRLDAVPEEPLPWLLVTAHNTIRNRYRAQSRDLERARRAGQLSLLATESAEMTAERRRAILTALSVLSHDEREAVLLTSWDGLTGAQAAQVLGCTHAALRVRIHRARHKMAVALHDDPMQESGSLR